MTIGVGKAYQRQGIAAALLQALVDEAKRQGASRMLLEVRVDNDPALALYHRFGFERIDCANATTSLKASTHTP